MSALKIEFEFADGLNAEYTAEDHGEARDHGALVVCFVPARVDTNWWHTYAAKASEIRFPKGRAKNPDGGAWPFPVAVVVFRPRV
jgi:hypothetical protein